MSDDRAEVTREGYVRTKADRIAQGGDIIGGLVEYIKIHDWVTMVEIQNFLKYHGVETEGDYWWGMEDMNLYFWVQMSGEFCDLMEAIRESQEIQIEAASPLTYLIDGGMLTLPLAKRPPKNGYKEEHWAPVCFRHKGTIATRGG